MLCESSQVGTNIGDDDQLLSRMYTTLHLGLAIVITRCLPSFARATCQQTIRPLACCVRLHRRAESLVLRFASAQRRSDNKHAGCVFTGEWRPGEYEQLVLSLWCDVSLIVSLLKLGGHVKHELDGVRDMGTSNTSRCLRHAVSKFDRCVTILPCASAATFCSSQRTRVHLTCCWYGSHRIVGSPHRRSDRMTTSLQHHSARPCQLPSAHDQRRGTMLERHGTGAR